MRGIYKFDLYSLSYDVDVRPRRGRMLLSIIGYR